MLNRLHDGLWEIERPLKMPGLRMSHRMTVARLASKDLWVHSPVEFDESIGSALRAIGSPAHFIAPSSYHDLYWPEWFKRFPQATFHCAPGVKEEHPELPFQRTLATARPETWETELSKFLIRGMPKLNEFVFLHRSSRTLMVADLVFNFDVLTLLLLPYWALIPTHISEALRGRTGVSLVFAFTAVGHFVRTSAMTQMLPAWVPMRVALIYITGILELICAIAILIPFASRHAGIALCIFLLLILPSNVYAAFQRVDFGGHGAGPVYILVRIPLQLFLIGWIYWYAIRPYEGTAS